MALYLLYGSKYNQLQRMATAATPESASSLYPIANLYDGIPNKPFMFSTYAGSYVDFDLNQVVNGDFETVFVSSLPSASGWTVEAGCGTTRNLVSPKNGVACLEVTDSGGPAAIAATYAHTVASGEKLTLTMWARNNGAGTATVYVYNPDTGNYLSAAGAWGASVAWLSNATSTYAQVTTTFTVEPYSTTKTDTTRLWIRFHRGYYDDMFIWPAVDFASVHGHNLLPSQAPIEIRSATTSPGTTVRGTFTLSHPTMFVTFSQVTADRYWRLFCTADAPTNDNPRYLGEVVLGQYATATRRQNYGQEYTLIDPQDRTQSDIGPLQAFIRTTGGRRQVSMQFRLNDTATDYAQWKEILERSRNGAYPLVVVVESGDSTTCIMGRVDSAWRHSRVTGNVRDHALVLDELPFPVVVA